LKLAERKFYKKQFPSLAQLHSQYATQHCKNLETFIYLLRGALHPWTSRVPMVALVVVIVMPMAPSYRQVKKTFNMRGNKSDKGKDD